MNYERTFSAVLQDIVGNIQNIVRSEIRLVKTEIKEDAVQAGKSARILAAGSVLAVYAGATLVLTLVRVLETVLAPWQAALVIAAVVGTAAWLLISMGRSRMNHVDAVPEKTVRSVKENVEWAKDQIK